MRRAVLASLMTLLGIACGGGGGVAPAGDAAPGDAASFVDGGVGPDAATPLSWVDFAVSGCTPTSEDPPACRAAAPATLGFVTVAPAPVSTWLWQFGDGATAAEPSPEHEFRLPGVYGVTLTVAGPGGTARADRPMRVEIVPAAPGDACDLDAQCAPAGECICGEGEGCEAPLAGGLCARACDAAAACDTDAACADLSLAGFTAPWRRALCLRTCAADGDCGAGRVCRSLPARGGGWMRGCFVAGLVADVGGSCAGGDGAPDDARCASAHCAALGARGLCTATCATSADCPEGTACATFSGAGTVGKACVVRCGAAPGAACDADPWLACEAPGGAGRFGFTVDESPSAGGYCAPRTCSVDADCGAGGACKSLSGARFCTAP